MKHSHLIKLEKENPEFVSEVSGLNEDDLIKRIVELAKSLESLEQDLESNQNITDAKEELQLLLGPFKDAKKLLKLKTQYLLQLLKDQGK